MDDKNISAIEKMKQAQASYESIGGPSSGSILQPWDPDLIKYLTLLILGFSCVALVVTGILLWRVNSPPMQVLRAVGVILILGFSAILLVVGYGNEQLTPIVGLFGAIAGYLLGKEGNSEIKK